MSFDYEIITGEKMGDVQALADRLREEVSKLENRIAGQDRDLNAYDAEYEKVRNTADMAERELTTCRRTIARLKEELEGQRDHAALRAKMQDATISAQKKLLGKLSAELVQAEQRQRDNHRDGGVMYRLATQVAEKQKHVDALLADLERVEERHAALVTEVRTVIERVSKRIHLAQRGRSYPFSPEGIGATARRDAFGLVHRWLTALLESEPPEPEPEDEAIACVNCEAEEPAHAS